MTRASACAAAILLALTCLAGCAGQSAESRRKQAQSNADKYWEFLRANNPEGAYDNTFSANYKRNVSLESYLAFQRGLTDKTGAVTSYTVVRYDADPEKDRVSLGYNVQMEKLTAPALFEIKMVEDGTEWRVDSIEPKQMPVTQPPPQPRPAPQPPASQKKAN